MQSPPKNGSSPVSTTGYKNGIPAWMMPGALYKVKAEDLDISTVLRVVGPLVNYGCKLY